MSQCVLNVDGNYYVYVAIIIFHFHQNQYDVSIMKMFIFIAVVLIFFSVMEINNISAIQFLIFYSID